MGLRLGLSRLVRLERTEEVAATHVLEHKVDAARVLWCDTQVVGMRGAPGQAALRL